MTSLNEMRRELREKYERLKKASSHSNQSIDRNSRVCRIMKQVGEYENSIFLAQLALRNFDEMEFIKRMRENIEAMKSLSQLTGLDFSESIELKRQSIEKARNKKWGEAISGLAWGDSSFWNSVETICTPND